MNFNVKIMKSTIIKSLSLIVVALAIILPYSLKVDSAFAAPNCVGRNMTVEEYKWFKSHGQASVTITENDEAGKGVAHITNNTDCSMPVGLESYQMYDNILQNQTKFDSNSTVIAPHTVGAKLKVLIPECMVQIDAYLGAGWELGSNNTIAWLIANQVSGTGLHDVSGNYCKRPTALIVSCSATPSSVNEGESIKWNVQASGGDGEYTYDWSGTDGLSGTNKNINKIYQTSGTKNASVTVKSGSRTKVANCTAEVRDVVSPLSISCSSNPSTVGQNGTIRWTANASGGDGNYSYSWSGTDDLSGTGESISKSYQFIGTKSATVTVTSGSRTRTTNCSAEVVDRPSQLNVSCSPSSSSVRKNDSVYWYASVSGGNGNYSYSWSGTDGLYGSGSSLYKSYSYTGNKNATVVVTSNGYSVAASCNLNVFEDYTPNTYLEGSCSATPYNGQVGTNISWTANAYGGTGNYYYSWSGTDGLYGSGSYMTKNYYTPGYKTATVTITSGGLSITRTCSTNIGQVLAYTETNNLPTLTSVYLSDIPYTGIEDKFQVLAFVLGLIGFSALIAYFFIRRKMEDTMPVESVAAVTAVSEDLMTDKFVCDRVVTDKQASENVEDIAMNSKTVLSSDAIGTIVKAARMNCSDEKEIAQKVIVACRKDKNQADGEWCVIGEEDVRKII
jgi:hypothetical protein